MISYAEKITNHMISLLEKNEAPWQKEWDTGQLKAPYNPISKYQYSGINLLTLISQKEPDPRWMTVQQANSMGFQVKKDSKPTTIAFLQYNKLEEVKDPKTGKISIEEVKLPKPVYKYYHVFNGKDIAGLPEFELNFLKKPDIQRKEIHQKCRDILKQNNIKIDHSLNKTPHFNQLEDKIHMTRQANFKNYDTYYRYLMNELGTWTGHPNRLNRETEAAFGTKAYAKETLRKSIADFYLSAQIGIGTVANNFDEVKKQWISILKEDKLEIFKASKDAVKMQNFIINGPTKELLYVNKQSQQKTKEYALAIS